MRIGHLCRIAGFSALIAALPGAASATMISDTTKNISYWGSSPAQIFRTGTGVPAIFSLTEPSVLWVVKYSVFQSSPPKAMLVVWG